MNRRAFFARLGGAVVAGLASPALVHASPLTGLAFHPDAFALTMAPITLDELRARYIDPAVCRVVDDHDRRCAALCQADQEWSSGGGQTWE